MKHQSIQSLSIALILFSLGQIAFGQGEGEVKPVEDHGYWIDSDGVIPMLSKDEANELNAAIAVGDDVKIEAIKKRHKQRREDRQNRRKPIDPLPDDPIPDQNEGEGESVSPVDPANPDADSTIEPVEGREERERRRREREQKQREKEERKREQEEYERAHPKPPKLSFIGWIWSWTLGPILSAIFWPIGWIFTLIKWGGILVLLTVIVCMVAIGILCGSVCMKVIRWTLDRLIGKPKDPLP